MKKTIVLIGALFFSTLAYADWVNDWLDQSTSSGPNYFEGQQRGYFSGGNYSARWRNKKEYLMSVQAPRLRSGCGGIDLFMGGFSFMDPDYLMEKMQKALQAAPAVAFDLALKLSCRDCAATIKDFENLVNSLNSMQISECGLGQNMVQLVRGDNPDIVGQATKVADAAESLATSITDLWTGHNKDVTNNEDKSLTEMRDAIGSCPAEFTDVFATPGSVLAHIAEKKGLGAYTDYMRAFLGDVYITYQDKMFGAKTISPCADNDITRINDLLEGTTIESVLDEQGINHCEKKTGQGLYQYTSRMLTAIGSKMQVKDGGLTAEERSFMSGMPMPIYRTLRAASTHDVVDLTVSALREPTAQTMAYAIADDLVGQIWELNRVAKDNSSSTGAGGDQCNPNVVSHVVTKVDDLYKNAKDMYAHFKQTRLQSMSAYVDSVEFSNVLEKQSGNNEKDIDVRFKR